MASGGRESNIYSSDDESLQPVQKPRRKPKALISSDSEDDSDIERKPRKNVKPLDCESEDSDENFNNDANFSSETKFCSNTEEDFSTLNDNSDNEQSEKCAICLSKFTGQDIATPETCDHMFCLECLQEWAKNVNTCPIDRLKFNLILIRHHKEEKIVRRIFVNCPEIPWLYESESDSNIQTEISSCGFCGEHDNEDALLRCRECHKTFHLDCLIPPPIQLSSSSRICPCCASIIRIKRSKSSRRLDLLDSNSLSSALGMTFSEDLTQQTTNRGLWRLRQKTHELVQRLKRRRVVSSSDSSDEETEQSNRSSVRLYQDQISAKSLCPYIQKRRREVCRSHSRALISSTASAASNSDLYSVDSDDGINDRRFENYNSYDRLVMHHGHASSTSRTFSSDHARNKTVASDCPPANFDLVGSILQSQTILHRSDVLTVKKDGSLLLSSEINSDSPLNSPSATSSISSAEKNENIQNPIFKSSVFDNKSSLPYTGGAVYNQRPMNPSQNTSSKYREAPRENHSCSSSTTSMYSTVDFDSGNISSRNTVDNSGNEKYNNDNSCSSLIHKSFCGSSAVDEIKKSTSNFKESNKGHHSEEEVDIYSDIESVGEDEGVCNTIDNVSDRLESMKMPYKGDESPTINPGAASDSSDNELIIDEDMAAEEESDNRKEVQVNNTNNKNEIVKDEQVNESDDSNISYSESFVQDQMDNGTPDILEGNCSYVENISVENNQLGEESSQGTYQDNIDPEGIKLESEFSGSKNECGYEENKVDSEDDDNESDDEMKNGSDDEVKNGSDDEVKNGSDDEVKNGSDDEEKQKSEEENKNESEYEEDKNNSGCEDQESDMDVQEYEENSIDSPKKSSRAGTSTPCSTISSKQFDEEMKPESLEGQCDNSISSENQDFSDIVYNDETGKDKDANENTNDSVSQVEDNENYQNEANSNFSFESIQHVSESEEAMDSNIDASQPFSEMNKKDLHNICNDTDKKSDCHEDDDNLVNSDNIDVSENASTPCLDENFDDQIENSPVHDALGSNEKDLKSEYARKNDFDQKSDRSPSTGEYESGENKINEHLSEEHFDYNTENAPENSVDLGIEDISEAGSGDLDDDFPDENVLFSENKKHLYANEREDSSNLESNDVGDPKITNKGSAEDVHSQNSNDSYDDREEGEIIEEKPLSRSDRKHNSKFDCYLDEADDYPPRVNISDLPRIPKIKRDRAKDNIPHELPMETKRTSVLGRVDLGGGDISWKRLSKHTRDRSYRDGRPKDDRVLYRERDSRKKDKKYDHEWRSDSKSSRREDKKQDSEKLRNEYESRSRKNDRKDKGSDWSYLDRDKRGKSHKEKHKDKHKDKKDKSKHDKTKHTKEESKYARDKIKDEDHYDREFRFDKEQRFERIVYEKGKFKEKDHKSKHKDRKSDNKSSKDHSREKHKHVHTNDHFSEKQREREVRKIDDKIKVVVEQKEGRKEKSKHKDKKESKHDKKQTHHHEHRKKDIERSPYTELSSIESKEIFAKGDSIIINVNFNRTNSPKEMSTDNNDSNFKDRKVIEEFELDESVTTEKNKSKHSISEKLKVPDVVTKRPSTPPERINQVMSVSESYWQGGEDSDVNNSPTSEKSVEEITIAEDENETMESADAFEGDNFSNSCNSADLPESHLTVKEGTLGNEETTDKLEKVDVPFSRENEIAIPPKRKSPRSPSPPSPADNDSYDPCEPTRSPSPPPVPPAPPLPLGNPKPPPSPELPPLPPEPEPIDNIREEITHKQSVSPEFTVSSAAVSSSSQPVTVIPQASVANSVSLPSILLPPPSFLSHTSATTNSIPTLSSLLPPQNFNFQVNSHPNVIFPPNHVQQVLQGIVSSQLHTGTTIPPPPNPPSLPHMGSVPPPPPPPSAMALISQVTHPQMNVRPALPPNSLLQNLTLGHTVTLPQMQMSHLPHIPPNLSNPLSQPMLIPSQNQPVSLSLSIQNQASRVIFTQNQMMNHSAMLQNQNNMNNKPLNNIILHQPLAHSTPQKPDKISAAEKQEVVDMEVDSPYSPGDSPSMDSVCDYSPTCSPLPSSPKSKDLFDSLLPTDHRTNDRKIHEASFKAEKSKHSDSKGDVPSKKAKHEHKRHSVRLQIADKGKSRREQKAEKKLDDSQLKILDELPSSAVEMQVKEKFLKKLNRQERVVEEVKLALKPYYKTRDVTKEEYKDILRKSVPKICHNKSGEINPVKVKTLVECYIKKIKHSRKKADKKKSSKLS